jgi:hypothetical protein
MPQTLKSPLEAISLKYALHLSAAKRNSRGSSGVNCLPVNAPTGQMSTHFVQFPHLIGNCFTLFFVAASVNTVDQRTRGPCIGVIRRQLFPIQPNPLRFAASLCEKEAQILLSSTLSDADIGNA